MPVHLSRAIKAKAKRDSISVSKLTERAIRKVLPLVEASVASVPARSSVELEIPENWKEVACIDFTGYLDRDCELRIIYKTPEGGLKAARHSDDEPEVIEDVTREQVTKWLQECVIPEEFAADFSSLDSTLARRAAQWKARDVLGDAVHRTAALNEALAALIYLTEKVGEPLMSQAANDGMMAVAIKESADLREAFLKI